MAIVSFRTGNNHAKYIIKNISRGEFIIIIIMIIIIIIIIIIITIIIKLKK